jgi:hypothetical protein
VAEIHNKIHQEDSVERDERTRDRDPDAVLHFGPPRDAFTPTDTMGCVFGKFTSSPSVQTSFYGCDTVDIVG